MAIHVQKKECDEPEWKEWGYTARLVMFVSDEKIFAIASDEDRTSA
jgi:hypothetical protein